MSTWSNCIAFRKVMASCAICSMRWGVFPVVPPTPTLSKVTTWRDDASASISAGSQLSRFPRKCCRRTRGTPPWPASRYTYSTPLPALTVWFESSAYVSAVVIVQSLVCSLADRHLIETPALQPPIRMRCGSANTSPKFRLRRAKLASTSGQRTWPVADRRTRTAPECRSAGQLSGRR
jgi:hypothetical protein